MKTNFTFCFLINVLFFFNGFAQSISHHKPKDDFSIVSVKTYSLNPGIGIAFERFLNQEFGVEVDLQGNFWDRYDKSWSVGISLKVYPFYKKERQLHSYTGFSSMIYQYFNRKYYHLHYIPLGLSYFFSNDCYLSLDLGPAYVDLLKDDSLISEDDFKNQFGIYGEFKMGMNF